MIEESSIINIWSSSLGRRDWFKGHSIAQIFIILQIWTTILGNIEQKMYIYGMYV